MIEVGFSLGSNIGDKLANLRNALSLLADGKDIVLSACSSFYRTAPWGFEDQDWFVNACAAGRTLLPPEGVLARCKAVEAKVGREKTFRWGPRVIDVDILYYGADEIAVPELAIPHRELFNRGFVLIPLAEIRPDLVLSGRSVREEARRFAAEPMEIVAPPLGPTGFTSRW